MGNDRFFDLVRHGEPVGGGYFRGSLDDPLSEKGFTQLENSTAQYSDWDIIISSPLKRCYAFAKQISEKHKIPLVIEEELRERDFGDWEGKQAKEINPDDLNTFWQAPNDFTPPNAEVLADFIQRITSVWVKLKQEAYKKPLIITHGGVIRSVVGEVLGMPSNSLILLEVPYANISRIRIPEQGKESLVFHHLSPQAKI